MSASRCAICRGPIENPDQWNTCAGCNDAAHDLKDDARAVVLEILGRPQHDQRTRVIGFTFEVERVTSSRHTFTKD